MSLTNVEYSQKELDSIVLKNLLHMFERRNYIKDYKKTFQMISDSNSVLTNTIITINGDIESDSKNKSDVVVYQFYKSASKLNSISQGSPVDDFLKNDINNKKFLILSEQNKKVFKQSREQYPNTEVFSQNELLEDIPSKDIIPNHHLLIKEEKEEILTHFKQKNFKKIFEYDIMSRYYGAVPGDIFRIERFNTTSGKGIDYRTVVPGKYDIIF
jgi:DNA-directed RNA polymerase subunit H (RpoH/RPB5)